MPADESTEAVVETSGTTKAQEVVDEDLERRRRYHRIGTHWKKPPLKVYADNFGFGVNGYQSMIDYLDEKDYYGKDRKKEKVHLPLLEERCLDSYWSKKPFKFYENNEINDYIQKGHDIRSQIRQNDVVCPGNVLHRTHTNWSMTKKYVQQVKKSNVKDLRKIRAEKELANSGYYVPEDLKSVGVTFCLNTMDPMNLTLYKAHNNLDHAIYMNARRERLSGLDHQFDDVMTTMSENCDDLNRRAKKELRPRNRTNVLTEYDKAQSMAELANISEDLAARNRLKRQLEFQAMEEGVDDVIRLDTSRNRIRNNLRSLDDTVKTMEDEVSIMRRRHAEERAEYITPEALRAQAHRKARLALNLGVDDGDVDDPELARLRMRRAHAYEPLDDPAVLPFHKYRSDPEVVSDVQSRVLARAGELQGQTSIQRHVNNRARYVNIYVPKYNTADPHLIVKPTRTEMNIDHMAKSLAQKGRIQRRFDVDDEADLPVSSLNTYANRQYCKRECMKPIDHVISNSNMVRGAVIRARERSALQGC